MTYVHRNCGVCALANGQKPQQWTGKMLVDVVVNSGCIFIENVIRMTFRGVKQKSNLLQKAQRNAELLAQILPCVRMLRVRNGGCNATQWLAVTAQPINCLTYPNSPPTQGNKSNKCTSNTKIPKHQESVEGT